MPEVRLPTANRKKADAGALRKLAKRDAGNRDLSMADWERTVANLPHNESVYLDATEMVEKVVAKQVKIVPSPMPIRIARNRDRWFVQRGEHEVKAFGSAAAALAAALEWGKLPDGKQSISLPEGAPKAPAAPAPAAKSKGADE